MIFDEVPIKDNFAVAQVALYLFAIFQMVLALMTVMGAVPLGIALNSHWGRTSALDEEKR
jgi:hypothetical protein